MRRSLSLPRLLGAFALAGLATWGGLTYGEGRGAPSAATPEEAADAFVAARRANDGRAAAIVAEETPDPWLVCDALLAKGARDDAAAFAAAFAGADADALRAFVARPAGGDADATARRALAAGGAPACSGEAPAGASTLERLPRCDACNDVIGAQVLRVRGHALHELGREAEAATELSLAAERAERVGWRAFAAEAYGEAGASATAVASMDVAARCFERVVAIAVARKDARTEASGLTRLGRIRQYRGDLAGALEVLTRALSIRERDGDPKAWAATLRTIGLVHEETGELVRAREEQTRALALSDSVGDVSGSASALGNLGGLHWRTGEYAVSLGYQERSLALLETLGDIRRTGTTLANLGIVYQRLGATDRALSCYERSLTRLDAVGDHVRAATVLGNLGGLYASLGESDRALGYLERARATSEAAGDRAGVAAALANEGYLQTRLGNCEEALSAHERSLAVREALGDREGAAEARMALGLVYSARGDPERALTLLRKAVVEAELIGAQDTLVVSLWATAAARLQAGEAAEAVAAARRAIEEMPAMVGGLSDEHGALVRQRLAPVFETGLRAALALGDAEATEFFLESGRAGALLEALGGRDRLHDVLIPADLRAGEARARAVEAHALSSYRKSLDGNDLVAARTARAEYEASRQGVRQAIERIQREAKAAAHLVYPRAVPLAEVRGALKADEALLTYATLAERTVAFVVTRDGARAVPLGPSDEIEKACRALSTASSPGADPAEEVAALAALVVAPLALPEGVHRVLVSPDGPLAFVPFCLLLPTREIACVPSATTWRLLALDGAPTGVGVLAIGDPDYETDGAGANQLARMSAGVGFPPLPYTREEAKAVGDVVLLGLEATEAGFRYAVGRRPRWRAVHLACHGLVDPVAPLLSSLALTPTDDDDGFLTAMDVLQMRIASDVVVLSACRTGRGTSVRAEGVLGFVRAFMFAGSPRVVVSLWNGDDEATRALMVRFHALLKEGRPAVSALAGAQATVRANERWRHPYYWAGWVLWGVPD